MYYFCWIVWNFQFSLSPVKYLKVDIDMVDFTVSYVHYVKILQTNFIVKWKIL